MKDQDLIIATSNYSLETFSEYIALDVSKLHYQMAMDILKAMNSSRYRSEDVWYVLKPKDYKLYRFEP